MAASGADSISFPSSSLPALVQIQLQPVAVRPAELESAPILTESLINWTPTPDGDTVAPMSLMDHGASSSSSSNSSSHPNSNSTPERPVLQVHTHDLEQYRAQCRKRSKLLAPSTSVRSTASTSSTDSTNSYTSYTSTASYNISPMSEWSGAWARAPDFESTLTSPADDLFSPGGLLSTNQFSKAPKSAHGRDPSGYADEASMSDPFLSELPADTPMMDPIPPPITHPNIVGLDQPVLSLDASAPPDVSSNMAFVDNPTNTTTMPPMMPSAVALPPTDRYASPRSLVMTVWGSLELHVAASMEKLERMGKNHIVTQLRNMTSHAIAHAGLQVLNEMLQGHQPTDPVRLLCFIHLISTISLVVHEHDASARWTDLFGQAMSYSTWLPSQDRQAYIAIVDSLWKPAGMTKSDVVSLVRAKTARSVAKGKEPAVPGLSHSMEDSMVFVAQYFLDQLEHATINPMIPTIDAKDIQTSQLYLHHLNDPSMDVTENSPFVMTVNYTFKHGLQQYNGVPAFVNCLNHILSRVKSNHVATPRRLELELMHAGKMTLAPTVYYDQFISRVRLQMDSLYNMNVPDINSRTVYYRHGIDLIAAMVRPPTSMTLNATAPTDLSFAGPDSIDELLGAISPEIGNFDFGYVGPFPTDAQLDFACPTPGMTVDPCNLGNPQPLPTPEGSTSMGGLSTAATSPPSPGAGQSASKVESDSCCDICGYRPKGDPRWFGGSMAKHKKLQHATTPPKIYRCPFPGCTSQYKNRPDNLRQHQIEKGHFVDAQAEASRRPSKRKKVE